MLDCVCLFSRVFDRRGKVDPVASIEEGIIRSTELQWRDEALCWEASPEIPTIAAARASRFECNYFQVSIFRRANDCSLRLTQVQKDA